MDDDLEKMAAQCKTFTKEMVDNPYRGIATFYGLPCTESLENLDIALIGVPFDLGVTNRSGARMGPRELRNQSREVGVYNHCTRSTPCADHRIADLGDLPFRSVYRIEEALDDITAFYHAVAGAGVTPVTAGGDLVEVSPPYDHAGITALAGATILFEILCLAAEARKKRNA